MKIVSWNVQKQRRFVRKLLKLNAEADVLCAQEVPENFSLRKSGFYTPATTQKQNGYTINKYFSLHGNKGNAILTEVRIPDFVHRKDRKTVYLSIFTSLEIIDIKKIRYSDQKVTSLLTLFYKLRGDYQVYDALVVKVMTNGVVYSVVTLHLPVAANAKVRKDMMSTLFSALETLENPVIAGDMNVYDKKYMTLITAPIRGFKAKDVRVNERADADELYEKCGLVNIFSKVKTGYYFSSQFDHILVPNTFTIKSKKRNTYHSDHYAIEAEVFVNT